MDRPGAIWPSRCWSGSAPSCEPPVSDRSLTPSTILSYPGLGRTANPAASPPKDYEIRIEADLYRPLYRATAAGIAFAAFPYDDVHPPALVPSGPVEIRLLPGPAYPFPNHLPVVRGVVTDAGVPTADVLVSSTTTVGGVDLVERAVTDDAGQFALTLRWVAAGVPTTIEAVATPPIGSGRQGSIVVTLPDAIGTNQEIPLT